MSGSDRFVRVPTQLLEALLRERLSGGHYRVLFWVIRHSYGWNRPYAPFTWYRMARDLHMSRPAVYRAGQALVTAGILVVHERQLCIQVRAGDDRQLSIPGMDVAAKQRFSLPASNATVANRQLERCQEATLLRRAKDSSKDKLKTYKEKHLPNTDDAPHRTGAADNTQRQHLAGAAKPIPGKYDGLSQN